MNEQTKKQKVPTFLKSFRSGKQCNLYKLCVNNEIKLTLSRQTTPTKDRITPTKELQLPLTIIHDPNIQVSITICTQIHQFCHLKQFFFYFHEEDGKIYNLLEQDNDKRIITCGCVKSNCEAKYCQCFRWGQTCSEKCTCVGCKNKASRKQQSVEGKNQEQGCNCVKSGCRKKYCECYQRGRRCDETCNCRGCLNKC